MKSCASTSLQKQFLEGLNMYLTETEQLDQIKKWFSKYGFSLLVGFLIAGLVFAVWQWWHQYQYKISSHASQAYEQVLNQVTNEDVSVLEAQSNGLIENYPETIYASMTRFVLARTAVYSGDLDTAKQHLKWVIEHTPHKAFKEVARMRTARIALEQSKYQEALDALKSLDDPQYAPLVLEIRGDIYAAKGDIVSARQAYKEALQKLPGAGMTKPILEMKLQNLPEVA